MELGGTKIWWVGASEGIGRETCKLLAKKGAHVAISARNEERLTELYNEMEGEGHLSIPCDVIDQRSIKDAFEIVKNAWGDCDIVIYNAGAYDPMSLDAFDLKQSLQIVDVNLNGVLRVLEEVREHFILRKKGRIMLVGSVAAYRGLTKSLAYGASKAGVMNLAESLRFEFAPYNVEVQLVSPGFVKTRLTDKNDFKMPSRITPKKAAEEIVKGIEKDNYEIHFPKVFTLILKLLRVLPNVLFFTIMRKVL